MTICCALAGSVVSATSAAPLAASCTASGSATSGLYWMLSPRDPRHRCATQEAMARSSIGEPAAENAAFLNEQTLGVGAKLSGITIRSAQEQVLKVAPKSSWPIAKTLSCEWSAQLGGLASTFAALRGHDHQRAGVLLVAAEELDLRHRVDLDVGLAGAVRRR